MGFRLNLLIWRRSPGGTICSNVCENLNAPSDSCSRRWLRWSGCDYRWNELESIEWQEDSFSHRFRDCFFFLFSLSFFLCLLLNLIIKISNNKTTRLQMEMEFICLFCLKYSFFDNDKKHKWRLYGNEHIGEHVWVHISIVENQKYTKKKKNE